ncbi:hypothetical protein ASJ81_04735 [Methanosarcina spelaei]|uniref:Uncharacterized protein n=1 Tax=Methanosarcina spelaei TaxID=1036679 RepID=A0A2A2HUD7_9EURY|nr:hypothetical protein [Methanosarcina spelaei]PAV12900.1 hypothetical protein ASJ81_04735 [Methanosarcina spelaei]
MSLPEEISSFRHREFIFCFFFVLLFLIIFCAELSPVFAAVNGTDFEMERQEDAVITDFFSDCELSDATVRFEQPLENVSLVFTLSSEKKLLKSETFFLGPVKKGQEITRVLFWKIEDNFRKDRDSYKAQVLVKNGSQSISSRELSFSSRNPILSKLKLVDFSADSEKASILMSLTSSASLRTIQAPEPGMIDLDLKLLSDTEILYSEKQKNIPITSTYYNVSYWPLLLEKDKKYTAFLKVHSHSPDVTAAYISNFRAEEKVEIIDRDIDVDEYGASVTVVGKSQVPFDGIVRVVLMPEEGKVQVFEETADLLTSGKEDTVGIIWQGVPTGDYNVKIYVLNSKGEILDSYETVLRVFEPVPEAGPTKESPAPDFFTIFGIFLFVGTLFVRKRE